MNNFLKENGLDFTVNKVQNSANGILVPSYSNMVGDKCVGTVTNIYNVFQPNEMVELMQELSENFNYELEFAKVLKDGRQIMVMMKCSDKFIANDTIKNYIVGINSYDGTTNVQFTYLDKIVRCSNQFLKIQRNSDFSVRHNGKMNDNIQELRYKIGALNIQKETHYNNLEKFVHTKLSKDLAIKQISSILDFEFEIDGNTWEYGDISTRKKNQFDRFVNAYEIEERDLGQTVYTLMNSGSRYSTHVLEQPYSNQGLKISNQIYDNCLMLV